MKNKINIVELLKDCPKGMALDCSMFENLELDHINKDDEVYPIICRVKTEHGSCNYHSFNKYGCYGEEKYYKCVIFPKGKTTWEGFQRPFKDGDIAISDKGDIHLLRTENSSYCAYRENWKVLSKLDKTITTDIKVVRLATEEEKEKLFKEINDNGYKWNTKTKTLEKLLKFKVGDKIQHKNSGIHCTLGKYVEAFNGYRTNIGLVISYNDIDNWELSPDKFDINTLKPFDKVLVRFNSLDCWHIQYFEKYDKGEQKYHFICLCECKYEQCIPYEENKHLLDTSNNCDEYYKTWE